MASERTRPAAFWVGVLLNSSLILLLLPLIRPDLQQYEDKGMSWRVLVFPLACFIVPLLWRLTGSKPPYPYLADNLIVMLWNTLGTYRPDLVVGLGQPPCELDAL